MIFIIVSLALKILHPNLFSFNRSSINIILLYILAVFGATRGDLNAYLGAIINVFVFVFFAGLKDIYKIEFFNFFIKAFTILIGISLFGWILLLLDVNLPNSEITYGVLYGKSQYLFQNYYIFMKFIPQYFTLIFFQRFVGVFLEAGYLGIFLVILLYLNDFDLKNKFNLILFIALLFTLSLAGWVLGFFSYLAYVLKNSKYRLKIFVSFILISIAFYSFIRFYNDGNNVINNAIILRLKWDDTRGTIEGYNRTSGSFDRWFEDYFINSPNIFFGLGTEVKNQFEDPGASWEIFFTYYGLMGLMLYGIYLIYYPLKYKNYSSYILFFLYVAIFYRGQYEIFWSAFPILYLCGFAVLNNKPDGKIEYSNN